MIPRKFDTELLEVFDIKLKNFSLLTILPDTQAKMKKHLASERTLDENNCVPFHAEEWKTRWI